MVSRFGLRFGLDLVGYLAGSRRRFTDGEGGYTGYD
jgi:hypothetical protein